MIGNYDWTISNRKKLNRRTHVSLLMAAIAEICFHRDLRRSKRNGNRWCLLSDAYLASARIYATAVFSHSNNGNNLRPGICYRNATGNPFPFATPLIPSVEYPFSFLSFSPFSLSLSLSPLRLVFASSARGTSRGSLYNSFLSLFPLQHNGGYETQPKNVNTISRSKQQQQQQQVKKNKISLLFLFSFFLRNSLHVSPRTLYKP